jgi:hypothetical protein
VREGGGSRDGSEGTGRVCGERERVPLVLRYWPLVPEELPASAIDAVPWCWFSCPCLDYGEPESEEGRGGVILEELSSA